MFDVYMLVSIVISQIMLYAILFWMVRNKEKTIAFAKDTVESLEKHFVHQ
jgi:hypothetical protein